MDRPLPPAHRSGRTLLSVRFLVQAGARDPAGERQESYVVGGRGKRQSTFMEQPQSFNQKQREMFARLLQEARKREDVELESDDVESRAESDVVATLAEEQGAMALIAKV